MPEYDNTNRGAIWPNRDMREGKSDPEFTGSLNVEGVDYWVSAWKRKPGAKDNAPSLSFSIKPKGEKQAQRSSHAAPEPEPFDDDIPF